MSNDGDLQGPAVGRGRRHRLTMAVPGLPLAVGLVRRLVRAARSRRAEDCASDFLAELRLAEETAAAADDARGDRAWRAPSAPSRPAAARPIRHLARLATLVGHDYWVDAFRFSPDGRMLASGGGGSPSLFLWDVTEPSRPKRVAAVRRGGSVSVLAFAPTGDILATAVGDESVRLWQVHDDRRPARVATFAAGSGLLHMIDFSPDGRLLATGTLDNRTVRLWDVTGLKRPVCVATMRGYAEDVRDSPGPSLAFSPDGAILALAIWDERVALWDLADPAHPAQLGSLPVPDVASAMAFSPDGRGLVTAGATVTVWDVTEPTAPRARATMFRGVRKTTGVAFSRDGRMLAVGGADPDVLLWDVADLWHPVDSGLRIAATGGVAEVAFSPNGQVLATTNRRPGDYSIELWKLCRLGIAVPGSALP